MSTRTVKWSPLVIEPSLEGGVIHSIVGGVPLLKLGEWEADCFEIVKGWAIESERVEGTPCVRCHARRTKYDR